MWFLHPYYVNFILWNRTEKKGIFCNYSHWQDFLQRPDVMVETWDKYECWLNSYIQGCVLWWHGEPRESIKGREQGVVHSYFQNAAHPHLPTSLFSCYGNFYRTQMSFGSNLWVQDSLTNKQTDLTDVTLANEDINSILDDNANRPIQGNVAIQVVPHGGQIFNLCKWHQLVVKFGTNASYTTLWHRPGHLIIILNVAVKVAPSGGQSCSECTLVNCWINFRLMQVAQASGDIYNQGM